MPAETTAAEDGEGAGCGSQSDPAESALGLVRRLPVPEVRDYHQINRRVAQWLDAGVRHIRLEGVERQRLLLSGIHGEWRALIEVCGHAGPELAAGLDAPGLVVIGHDAVDDGAGRELSAGTLIVRGPCGAAFGYRQSGGRIIACGEVGPRLGLEQSGGDLVVLGEEGRLAGERQRGGRLLRFRNDTGEMAGHGRIGGEQIRGAAARQVVGEWWEPMEAFTGPLVRIAPWLVATKLLDTV